MPYGPSAGFSFSLNQPHWADSVIESLCLDSSKPPLFLKDLLQGSSYIPNGRMQLSSFIPDGSSTIKLFGFIPAGLSTVGQHSNRISSFNIINIITNLLNAADLLGIFVASRNIASCGEKVLA